MNARSTRPDSALYRAFWKAAQDAIFESAPDCPHLTGSDQTAVYCLCHPGTARCSSCHHAHLTAICPACDQPLPDDDRNELDHDLGPRRLTATGKLNIYIDPQLHAGAVVMPAVMRAFVCADCTIENDLRNLNMNR